MDVVKAIAEMAEGTTLRVEPGTYTVPIDKIDPKAGCTIDLTGVTLKIEGNDKTNYKIIKVSRPDITLLGGTIIGDRDSHKGTEGEWGMGVHVGKGAKNTKLIGVTCKNCWGDGFYVGGGEGVLIDRCLSDRNRRQGLSIVTGKAVTVRDSTFKNTAGTAPEAGIDIEPDKDAPGVYGVTITGCKFEKNNSYGIIVNDKKAPVEGVKVRGCTFTDNGRGTIKAQSYWTWWQQLLWRAHLFFPTTLG